MCLSPKPATEMSREAKVFFYLIILDIVCRGSLLMNVIFVTFSLRCYFGDGNFKKSIYENCS